MFKPADPSRRMPAVLQAHTKENLVFQLTLTALYLGGMWVKEGYELRQYDKRYKNLDTPTS